MTTPRDINTYGGVFLDQTPVQNPTTQQSAAFANRANEDLAQLTRTTTKARVTFIPVAAAGPVVVDALTITIASHYGSGSAQKPVITKTATGIYSAVFPASAIDSLAVTETVSFVDGDAAVRGPTNGSARVFSIATNTIVVYVYDAAGALADLTLDTIVLRAE
jgi:hypothetical protein